MRGVSSTEIEKRVAQALTVVQLKGHEDKLPGQLSGGQRNTRAVLAPKTRAAASRFGSICSMNGVITRMT